MLGLLRHWKVAFRVGLAGVGAWAASVAFHHLLDPHVLAGVDVNLRAGRKPAFVSTNLAVITAIAVALGPYLVRPLRRVSIAVIVMVGLAAIYLGPALASDVIGGLLLGLTAGAAILVGFGTSGGRPQRR